VLCSRGPTCRGGEHVLHSTAVSGTAGGTTQPAPWNYAFQIYTVITRNYA
jgi:hypothetical protein